MVSTKKVFKKQLIDIGDKMTITISETQFGWMDEPLKTTCETIQAKMLELLPSKEWESDDALWNAAVHSLGGDYDKYSRIYICLQCRQMYHGDYSSNSDPDRDFCGWECEESWLDANPAAEYNGELGEGEEE